MKYYLGIDSGGTKTRYTLAKENGEIVASVIGENTNYLQCGFDRLVANLKSGVKDAINIADINKNDIKYAFIGLAAFGEIKDDDKAVSEAVAQGLKGIEYSLEGDNVCGWGGSLGGRSGVNIIAGTGSITYAEDEDGNNSRCGGWGHWCGGDEGSAYWIGSQLINHFMRQSDGREERSLLYTEVKKQYQIADDFDLINLIVNKWQMDRVKIAQLSKLAYELALNNDKIALLIFDQAAFELAQLVNNSIKGLKFGDVIYVSYSGGVFKSGDLILNNLEKYLQDKMVLVDPLFEPSIGGVIMAMRRDNQIISKNILDKLTETKFVVTS